MDQCCAIQPVHARQRRVLRVVLWINAAMFFVEFGAGVAAHSTALLSDSIDMLGDAIVMDSVYMRSPAARHGRRAPRSSKGPSWALSGSGSWSRSA